jgi:tRNA-binding protein
MTGLAIGVATGEIGQKDISLSLIRLFFMSDQLVSWSDFQKIDIRVGTIIEVDDFPKARNPAYKIWVDLGELGIKKSSAQITKLYSKDELIGQQVLCVCNFEPRQIADFMSEILVTGFIQDDKTVVLAQPQQKIPNGLRLA